MLTSHDEIPVKAARTGLLLDPSVHNWLPICTTTYNERGLRALQRFYDVRLRETRNGLERASNGRESFNRRTNIWLGIGAAFGVVGCHIGAS